MLAHPFWFTPVKASQVAGHVKEQRLLGLAKQGAGTAEDLLQ